MKKIQTTIADFKSKLDDEFEDKFAIKRDPTHRLVIRFSRLRTKLFRKLWYE